MPRVKRWTMTDINDGIGEVRLISWKYFHDFIYQEMLTIKPIYGEAKDVTIGY